MERAPPIVPALAESPLEFIYCRPGTSWASQARADRPLRAFAQAPGQPMYGAFHGRAAWNGPHRLCPHSLSYRSSSSTTAPAPCGHHKPEQIDHDGLLPRRLGNPTKGACPCRSARTRATPAAAAPARQRASKRHAGWLSRVWAVLRGTVRRGTQPRPHTHTHAHSYQPVCIINTYYLTYPTPHTRDARLGRR